MIVIHKNVIRYKKENELHYVNKYVNNVTSLQMVQISLINEKLDSQINGRNMILFDLNFGKLFNFNILILFSTQDHLKKNCWDTLCARLKFEKNSLNCECADHILCSKYRYALFLYVNCTILIKQSNRNLSRKHNLRVPNVHHHFPLKLLQYFSISLLVSVLMLYQSCRHFSQLIRALTTKPECHIQ